MRRFGCGCCGCLLWLFAIALLTDAWVGSSWAIRAVELLTGAAVVVAVTYRQRRTSRHLEPQRIPGGR